MIAIFNTIKDLCNANASSLKNKSIAITKGFYEINDGGGSTYILRNKPVSKLNGILQENMDFKHTTMDPLVDNVTLIKLSDDLFADIETPKTNIINIRQLGGYSLEQSYMLKKEKYDNKEAIKIFLNLVKRRKDLLQLFIPSGHWCFSETNIRNIRSSTFGLSIIGNGNGTVILPYNDTQNYIWNVGRPLTEGHNRSDLYYGYTIQNLSFGCDQRSILNKKLLQIYGTNKKTIVLSALILRDQQNCIMNNLLFDCIFGTALDIDFLNESRVNNLRFHCCGSPNNAVIGLIDERGYSSAISDFKSNNTNSATSAIWFKHLFFDSCIGAFFDTTSANNVHNEIGTIIMSGTVNEYYNDKTLIKPNTIDNNKFLLYNGVTYVYGTKIITFQACQFDNWYIQDNKCYECIGFTGRLDASTRVITCNNVSLPEKRYLFYTPYSSLDGFNTTQTIRKGECIHYGTGYKIYGHRCWYQRNLLYGTNNQIKMSYNDTNVLNPSGIIQNKSISGWGASIKLVPGKIYGVKSKTTISNSNVEKLYQDGEWNFYKIKPVNKDTTIELIGCIDFFFEL